MSDSKDTATANHAPVEVKVPTIDEMVAVHSPRFPKPWTPCKFCGKDENGPHDAGCPGDAPALLRRIQLLEQALRVLANFNGNQIVRDAVQEALEGKKDE